MQKLTGFFVVQYVLISLVLAAEPQVIVKGLKGRIEEGKALATFSVSVSSGYIAKFMMMESGVSKFSDDVGTDLGSKPVDKMSDYITMPYYAGVSSSWGEGVEKTTYTVDISSMAKPSPNAKSLSLAGELRMKYADYEQTNEIKNIAIKEGAVFSMGQQSVKITKVIKSANKTEFDAEIMNPPEEFEVGEINIFDAAGGEIRMSKTEMRSKAGEGPVKYVLMFYGIEGDLGNVTLKNKQWVGLKDLRIPYSIKVPVGEGAQSVVGTAVKPHVIEKSKVQAASVAGVKSVAVPQVQSGGWPLLKISGVMGKGQSGSVFINGKMLNVGESIDGVKIESISNGSVVLKYQDTTKTLRSGQSTQ